MIFWKRFWQGALILALLATASCSQHRESSSLLLGGDVFLARAGQPIFDLESNPWGDLLGIRQTLPESILAVNLESPFGSMDERLSQKDRSMNLCASETAMNILNNIKVNLVSTANNHANDCQNDNSSASLAILTKSGIANAGGLGETIYQLAMDRRVAFLALNDVSEPYDLEALLLQIQEAHRKSKLVVVSVHWGHEYQAGPSDHQIELAASLVDAGADVVWGHHPHVLQPMQWMKSTVDGHRALILYSLGNLLSDQWMLNDAQNAVLIGLNFNDNGIQEITIIPLQMSFNTRSLYLVHDKEAFSWWVKRLGITELEDSKVKIRIWGQPVD